MSSDQPLNVPLPLTLSAVDKHVSLRSLRPKLYQLCKWLNHRTTHTRTWKATASSLLNARPERREGRLPQFARCTLITEGRTVPLRGLDLHLRGFKAGTFNEWRLRARDFA